MEISQIPTRKAQISSHGLTPNSIGMMLVGYNMPDVGNGFSKKFLVQRFSQKSLKSAAVIISEGSFMVIGGHSTKKDEIIQTDKCTMDKNKIECTLIDPGLEAYQAFPFVFSVADDFCKHLD